MVTYWSCAALLNLEAIFPLFWNEQNTIPQKGQRQPFFKAALLVVGGVLIRTPLKKVSARTVHCLATVRRPLNP